MGGGLPFPGVTHIYGHPHSGKTSLGAGLLRGFDKALVVDCNRKFAPQIHRNSIEDAVVLLPRDPTDFLSDVLDAIELLPKESIVLVDDVATIPEPLEWNLESYIFHFLKKIRRAVIDSGSCLILINQVRDRGKMTVPFAYNSVSPMAELELRMRRMRTFRDRIRVKVNTVFSNFVGPGSAFLDIYYDTGLSVGQAILDEGIIQGTIEVRGNTYYRDGVSLGTRKEAVLKLEETAGA